MQTVLLERENAHQADFEFLGVDVSLELARRNELISKFGQLGAEIDNFEHQRSKAAYEREFLDDIPYSASQIYYQDLYTLPYEHSLFRMNIDEQERGGLTELGFEELRARIRETREGLKTNGKENEVVIWYSPSGPAGDGRFKNLEFDSGRIYLSIVQPDDFTPSFDIKVDESIFPVSAFLNKMSDHEKNEDRWHYLPHPFRTHLSFQEFSDKIQTHWADKQIYVRQRFTDPQPYTLGEILTGIEEEFSSQEFTLQMAKLLEFRNNFVNFTYQAYVGPQADYLARRNGYLDPIRQALRQAIQRHQGFVVLYGCSAVGVRTADDLQNLEFNVKSIFDTLFRTAGLTNDEGWHDGSCVVCERKTRVGGCNICAPCARMF